MIDQPETVTLAWVRDQVKQITDGVAAGRHREASFNLIADELEIIVVEAVQRDACEDVDECMRALLELNSILFPSAVDSYFETNGERTDTGKDSDYDTTQ